MIDWNVKKFTIVRAFLSLADPFSSDNHLSKSQTRCIWYWKIKTSQGKKIKSHSNLSVNWWVGKNWRFNIICWIWQGRSYRAEFLIIINYLYKNFFSRMWEFFLEGDWLMKLSLKIAWRWCEADWVKVNWSVKATQITYEEFRRLCDFRRTYSPIYPHMWRIQGILVYRMINRPNFPAHVENTNS